MRFFSLLASISITTSSLLAAGHSDPVRYHRTEGGDWFTRVRALYIWPNDSSSSFGLIPDSGISIHPSWTGELDVSYMFTKNLSLELMLTTCRNTLVGINVLRGIDIGTSWLFPPTLSLQWRFIPSYFLQPYLGLGANYSLFYGEDCSLTNTTMTLSHSWSPVLQFGLDLFFYKNWLWNLDVKYISIDTTVQLTGLVPATVQLNMNPWFFGGGIGYKW
jgi:outer membrane protein